MSLLRILKRSLKDMVLGERRGAGRVAAVLGSNVILPEDVTIENHGSDSQISIGDHNIFLGGFHVRCYERGNVVIGCHNWASLRMQLVCANRLEIGDYCMFGRDVYISDTNEHPIDPDVRLACTKRYWDEGKPTERYQGVESSPTLIGNNVWVGERAIILKGVRIGDGATVAAGSVVTKSIPERAVAAGNPARVVKIVEKAKNEI